MAKTAVDAIGLWPPIPRPPRHELHDAKPDGWLVGRPSYDEGRKIWGQYAFDQRERAKAGHRSREWTAVGATELEVVREMVRCLRIIRAGGVPE